MAAITSLGGKPLALMLIISAVLITSGCVTDTGTTVTLGKGVAITGFESDYSGVSIESDDDVSLMLRVQNQGELDADNAEAQLYGIDLGEWGTGGFLTSETEPMGTLLAADPVTGTEGQSKTVQWTLRAPNLPKGNQFTYEPRVRVSYDYQTKARKPITLVDVDELKRLIQQGKTLSSDVTRTSSGPLSVEIRTGNFVKTQNYDDPFPLNIFITNDLWESGGSVVEGSGFFGYGFDQFQYPVQVKLTLPDGMSLSGTGQGCSTSGEWVNLWKGKSADLTCEIRVTNPPEISVEKLIQVELDYRFSLDSSTTITVVGTDEDYFF